MSKKKRTLSAQPAQSLQGQGVPEQSRPDGMSDEELKYRMMLQEAVLWVTRQVLEERREEITKRAEDRVKTLQELRG